MFSRVAFRKGWANLAVALRDGSKLQPLAASCFHTQTKDTVKTQRLIDRWDECNKKYYGPERDFVNFPHLVMPETHDTVRLGFIPSAWFDSLYSKTGVSGPYFALGGLSVFLLSKEIMVYDHGFFELVAFWGAVMIVVKKGGNTIGSFINERRDKLKELNIDAPINRSRQAFTDAVGTLDTEIMEEGRHKYAYEVEQENLDIQLEARYRERVAQVYSAIKKRLDYQVELVSTKKRLEQKHMVNWIVDSVVKGISPKQEKDAIASCIGNLNVLAKTQSTAV